MSSAGATLLGSFSGATGIISDRGFRYRKLGTSEWTTVGLNSTTGSSGCFSKVIGGLSESTTYEYQAFVTEFNASTTQYEDRWGSVKTFTTSASTVPTGETLNANWMELPASPSSLGNRKLVTMRATMGGKDTRNYSILYDPQYYAATWVAFNYCKAHRGSGSLSSWNVNPQISEDLQVTPSYPSGYDRGHQIPNALRNGETSMQKQTYYYTNSTPQLKEFNQGIWQNLETAERTIIDNSSASPTDTLYIVTGPVYKTKGGNESVSTFTTGGKTVSVPNFYFRVILKVRRNTSGTVTAASAIGFWMPHDTDTGADDYAQYACSVDSIEDKTGFDFFANLPSSVESSAEANTSWTTFKSFSF